MLREEVVNPLRRHGYVRADRVMKLRTLLERLSDVPGLTSEEKVKTHISLQTDPTGTHTHAHAGARASALTRINKRLITCELLTNNFTKCRLTMKLMNKLNNIGVCRFRIQKSS